MSSCSGDHERRSGIDAATEAGPLAGPASVRITFPGEPITPTRNPMTAVYGIRKGETCSSCEHLIRHRRWFKCQLRRNTHGAATDHRMNWPACGKFELAAEVRRRRVRHDVERQVYAHRSPRGGWTKAALAELGVPWPPPKGWLEQLIIDRTGTALGRRGRVVREIVPDDIPRPT